MLSSLDRLQQARVADIQDLVARVESAERFERFSEQSGISVTDLAAVLKYLIYWVIPGEKYLSGLVREDPLSSQAIQALRRAGIRTNLELLQAGRTLAGRQALAEASGLPAAVILDLGPPGRFFPPALGEQGDYFQSHRRRLCQPGSIGQRRSE